MEFHSGIASTASVGGTELPSTGWDVDPTIEIVNFRNSKTDAYSLKEGTFKDVTFTIRVDYDFDANPFQAPVSIDVGTILSNVRLYLQGGGSGGTGDFWHFPTAIVTGTPQSVETEGKISTTINATNSGEWGRPGSPVS
jgi:hypothetical protein